MWPYNNRYNDEEYPDPQKYLLGFYYPLRNLNNIGNNLVTSEIMETKLNSISNISNDKDYSNYNKTTLYTPDKKNNISPSAVATLRVNKNSTNKINLEDNDVNNKYTDFHNEKAFTKTSIQEDKTDKYTVSRYSNDKKSNAIKSTIENKEYKKYYENKKTMNLNVYNNNILKKLKIDYKKLISNNNKVLSKSIDNDTTSNIHNNNHYKIHHNHNSSVVESKVSSKNL